MDYMRIPLVWLADAYDQVADILQARLDLLERNIDVE